MSKRAFFLLVLFLLVLGPLAAGCQTAASASSSGPAPAAGGAPSDARPASAPVEAPGEPDEPLRSIPGERCRAKQSELDACRARGAHCGLAAPPQRHPCAGRGARCDERALEPSRRPANEEPRCLCTCDDEYKRRAEEVRDRSKDPVCEELVDLSTGKAQTVCREPELPR
jgi:hypothetical protein